MACQVLGSKVWERSYFSHAHSPHPNIVYVERGFNIKKKKKIKDKLYFILQLLPSQHVCLRSASCQTSPPPPPV